MTRERWVEVRNIVPIPVNVWWEYYKEMGGVCEIVQFEMLFRQCLREQPIFAKGDRMVKVTSESALRRLKSYYDTKFGI